ncbi:hypothetical protein BDV18DRAFT_9403 [Aspergillus unguis]
MDGPPPPPPPHGEKPNTTHGEYRRSSDLPEGNYDIFIIPPHSAGSGFLYLPSLQCERNSFIAGVACTLVAVYIWVTLMPMIKLWYATTVASGGGTGIAILAVGVVGIGGWAFGNHQAGSGGTSQQGPGSGPNWFGSGGPGASGASSTGGGGANYSRGGKAGGSNQQGNYGANFAGGPPPGPQHSENQYRANNEPPPQTPPGPSPEPNRGNKAGSGPQKSENKPQTAEDWERAREETKRKEDLRRKMEEFKRKREAEAREKERQRERENMEKELRERREQLEKEMAAAREAAAREAKLRAEKEAAEHRAKLEREEAEAKLKAERIAAQKKQREAETRARKEREEAEARAKAAQEEAEAKAKAEKEAAEKEAAAKAAAKKEADAKFAALKEAAAKKYAEKKAKDAQEAAAREAAATASKVSSASAPPPRTPSPKKPAPKTSAATAEEDAYSFRPYDRPRRPYQNSTYSESSYAPSQSTARTTPPPSYKGNYETKDPDKIVIKGVYAFNQAYMRTPVAQLVSGEGMVTNGLVLRITTEGLFIDDDVRGVGQREWDVKAWTMKLMEVWCPQVGPPKQNAQKPNSTFFRRSTNDAPSPEESDAYLANFLKVCKNTCRLATPGFSRNSTTSRESQPGGGLHILRATIRDQEGRRYVFVLQETEGWKVALGLQRLRKGSQVRALGVCGMALAETRTILSGLGY